MSEKAHIAQIANFIFDDDITEKDVTDAVGDVVAQAFHSCLEKSRALNLVPRPTMRPNFRWLAKQAVAAFWRSRGEAKIYYIARLAVKLQYRSQYEMAKRGI